MRNIFHPHHSAGSCRKWFGQILVSHHVMETPANHTCVLSQFCKNIFILFKKKTTWNRLLRIVWDSAAAVYFWLSLTFSERLCPWIFILSVIIAALIQRVSECDDETPPTRLPSSPKINNHHRNLKLEDGGEAAGHLSARRVGRPKTMESDVEHAGGERESVWWDASCATESVSSSTSVRTEADVTPIRRQRGASFF